MPPSLLIDQPSLQGFCPIADAVDTLASQADADGRGAVNTRPEVVEFMLDLAGYTACQPLHRMRLLEPSFGGGAFVLAAVGRLLRAFKAAGGGADLADCIRAVELHRSTFHATRQKIDALLAHWLTSLVQAPAAIQQTQRMLYNAPEYLQKA